MTVKEVTGLVSATVSAITTELADENSVSILGFGTFEVVERAAREGRNPSTGESMEIKASKSPKFKAGKSLKDIVNE